MIDKKSERMRETGRGEEMTDPPKPLNWNPWGLKHSKPFPTPGPPVTQACWDSAPGNDLTTICIKWQKFRPRKVMLDGSVDIDNLLGTYT